MIKVVFYLFLVLIHFLLISTLLCCLAQETTTTSSSLLMDDNVLTTDTILSETTTMSNNNSSNCSLTDEETDFVESTTVMSEPLPTPAASRYIKNSSESSYIKPLFHMIIQTSIASFILYNFNRTMY